MSRAGSSVAATAAFDALVVFELDELRWALPLGAVERIERAVEVTPLPGAPAVVTGVIEIHERVIPVFDLRRRFRLPPKETALTDHLVVARARKRTVAFLVDRASGVTEVPRGAQVRATDLVDGVENATGIARLDSGLVVVHDLDAFLSSEEEAALDRALERPET